MNIQQFVKKYLEEIKVAIDSIPLKKIEKIVNMIYITYKKNKCIYVIGNGGSGSTASHFACDLGKGTICEEKKRFKIISLNDNMPIITAFANDCGYDNVFSEQLKNILNREDLVISITGSGNSPNIIKAAELAKKRKAKTIGIMGFTGGILKSILDVGVIISGNNYGQIEDIHLILTHVISRYFQEMIKKEK